MSILDYSYTNARIRSLKSQLFTADFLKGLAACDSVEEIINLLSETNYGNDINQAVFLTSGVRGIENGLRNHLVNHVNFLKFRVLSKKALFLSMPILQRWDVHNIKVILRSQHAGRPPSEMEESFVPLGQLNLTALNELARALDIKEFISMLHTLGISYFEPLKKHLNEYLADRNLQKYETELDRFYFENAIRQISSKYFGYLDRFNQNKMFVKRMLQLEIDIVNILTAIRTGPVFLEEEEAEKLFINGGKIVSKEFFMELFREESLEGIIKKLSNTVFGPKMKKALEDVSATGFVSPIQRSLEELLIERANSLFKEYPLSIAPVIAYIWSKYNEVVNLRIVIRCKEADIPPEKIIKSFILVH